MTMLAVHTGTSTIRVLVTACDGSTVLCNTGIKRISTMYYFSSWGQPKDRLNSLTHFPIPLRQGLLLRLFDYIPDICDVPALMLIP